MPTTSSGEFVYASPGAVESYVQTDPAQFSLSTQGDPSEWRAFLEARQVEAKARIDEYCGRDFRNHAGDTVTLDGGATGRRILALPTPLRAVSEVRVDGETVPTDDYVVDTDDAQLIRTAPSSQDAVDRLAQRGDDHTGRPEWPTGYENIAVDCDWGYRSPPADIAEAEQKLVAHTAVGLTQMREGMVVQQDDVDLTVQLPSAMTAEVRGMLKAHREPGRMAGVI
jgi:hypothetical protein